MGRKGESKTLKRKPAPRFWPIHRKEFTWVVKPSAGTHSVEKCLPLTLALRDVLGLAKTRREAKIIVSSGKVYVDGRAIKEDDFPIGLMDTVTLADAEKHFRVLPSYKGLILNPTSKEEAEFKLCRIENKTVVSKGQIQLNLHDGSNLSVKTADIEKPGNVYQTLDTLKVGLPERQILEHVRMKENDSAIIIGGKNIGKQGKIVEIEKASGKKRRNALATIQDKDGNKYQTILSLLFATGERQPLIAVAEANSVV